MEIDGHSQRLRIIIRGAVQGVGFRPFVFRLATELELKGWVNNSSQGVSVEIEGARSNLEEFLLRIDQEKPPRSFIQSLESSFLDPVGYHDFEIRKSDPSGGKSALVLPDVATCPDCLREIFDQSNRRYLYPFTNCTNCGPRYSIIESLPYDRPNTSMKHFQMCSECQKEYTDPRDRRFHAQPNACPVCGPHLELWNPAGNCAATHHQALLEAAMAIRQGMVIAVKGIGGFHLMVDARKETAIQILRKRKRREEKPLALMYPSLELVKNHCEVAPLAERLLLSPECPIVLLPKNPTAGDIAPSVAPGNPYLGVMLPYTPLHHVLMRELGFPVVATSGNLKEEPICIDEYEALDRLQGIADLFLVHNRPIVRHIDDSIVRVIAGRECVLRRARGFAPLPVRVKTSNQPILAMGGHLKNTIAIAIEKDVFISQHIGDLETAQSLEAFRKTITSLTGLYDVKPHHIACDKHPDYLSTKYAKESGLPFTEIQHHYAHILSCMAENDIEGPALGVSWDGTGYGLDGTVWGGEFLLIKNDYFERFAHFRSFMLPGGESAIKEPRRAALGLLFEIFPHDLFNQQDLEPVRAFTNLELKNLWKMLEKNLNSPRTSSAGRLFDAVASFVGIRQVNAFEGQAAMQLEFLADRVDIDENYPYNIQSNYQPMVVDWEPMITKIIKDLQTKVTIDFIAAKFHRTLVEIIVDIAKIGGEKKVVLSGGCFQNKYLTERTIDRLRQEGFQPYWHQRIPPNDGGIALGQIVAANREGRVSMKPDKHINISF